MQRFFSDMNAIEHFTRSLDTHCDSLHCQHCSQTGQWVSHGFIYKQRSSTRREPVGKRIFCSNRYGRQGCGRTCQIYLASEIPQCHYNTTHLMIFVSALLINTIITTAYQQATQTAQSRNAWRWLNRLQQKMSVFRLAISRSQRHNSIPFITFKTRCLQTLLPTLNTLMNTFEHFAYFQRQQQISII